MSKCRICQSAYVDHGMICDACQESIPKNDINMTKESVEPYRAIGLDPYIGVVKFHRQYESQHPFWFKFIKTLILSCPLNLSNQVNTFQLYEDQNYSKNPKVEGVCKEVIVYGTILSGFLNENNTVKVKGKLNRKGTVIATEIFNLSSGSWLKRRGVLNALNVRIMTFVAILIMLGLIHYASTYVPIKSLVIMLAIIGLMLQFARRRSRR